MRRGKGIGDDVDGRPTPQVWTGRPLPFVSFHGPTLRVSMEEDRGACGEMAQTKLEVSMRESGEPRMRVGKSSQGASASSRGDAIRSIAHDFNNLIGVINGYVELLSLSQLDDAQQRQVGAIRSAAEEEGNLSQRLSDCAAALDAAQGRAEDTAMHEPSREAFDLGSTYVCLDAHAGAATRIEVTPNFWDTIDARRDLREGRLVALFRHDADWDHWEMHPNGEEMLVLVSGTMSFVFDQGGAERVVRLDPGQACIVPRGTWHRAIVRVPSTLLAVTAGRGTLHRPVQ
jgi:mannose-6-phosphate isomerase-like protein (cupin superfamily)